MPRQRIQHRGLPLARALLVAAVCAVLTISGQAHAQAAVPDRPSGLTAASVAHDSVTLTWDDPGDDSITGYQVLRRSRDGAEYGDGQGAAAFVAIEDDAGSVAATYTDASVNSHTRYVYRIKARSSDGLSPRSGYLNVETPDAPTPSAPTGLTAASVAHDSVTLTWDDPGDDSITGYQVLRRSRDGAEYGDGQGAAAFVAIEDDAGSVAATYTDASVNSHTRYVYRIKARSSDGLSPRSGYLNVETPDAPTPSAPTGLTAASVAHDSVTLTWDDPGDDSITHYKALRREGSSGSFTTLSANTGSADSTYTDSTVSAETEYEYRVVAVNIGGESPESDSLSVTTTSEGESIVIVEPPEEEDSPVAEEQQETVTPVLVSTLNLSGRYDHNVGERTELAQRFTTGTSRAGFELRSVSVRLGVFRRLNSGQVIPRDSQVSVWSAAEDVNGNHLPHRRLFRLSDPSGGEVENAVNVFTAPEGSLLSSADGLRRSVR